MADGRLSEAKAIPIDEVLSKLRHLDHMHKTGEGWAGPCPQCGGTRPGHRSDRFSITARNNLWHCRQCDRGGDQVALVEFVLAMPFKDALAYLVGEAPREITEEELRERERRQQQRTEEQQKKANRFRQAAQREARDTWRQAVRADGTLVEQYLELRRCNPVPHLGRMPSDVGYVADLDYVKKINGKFEVLHTGPAMVCRVEQNNGQALAVHKTWIDLDQYGGKAVIAGGTEKAKLMRGSKKGGAIKLHTPTNPVGLIMGEGIETTLSALVAAPDRLEQFAFWAGCDLGNMAGIQEKKK